MRIVKIRNDIIVKSKNIKLLLYKLDVSKEWYQEKKHPGKLTYLSSNEGFINVICKIFENMK